MRKKNRIRMNPLLALGCDKACEEKVFSEEFASGRLSICFKKKEGQTGDLVIVFVDKPLKR